MQKKTLLKKAQEAAAAAPEANEMALVPIVPGDGTLGRLFSSRPLIKGAAGSVSASTPYIYG